MDEQKQNNWKKFKYWLFSEGELSRTKKNAAEKMQISIRVTTKCRYNASKRLNNHGKFAFFTTTILSLGLIFIPLIQNSGIKLAFDGRVLNMMSTFLAVAVFVYSVVIGTAKYDSRADRLNQCGNQLKDLTREFDRLMDSSNGNPEKEKLEDLNKRYFEIITDTENHEDVDYISATLEMPRDYKITGFPFLKKYIEIRLRRLYPYLLPSALLLLEMVFITDMINITAILTSYLRQA